MTIERSSEHSLRRAYGYPYPAPSHDYLFADGRVEALPVDPDLGNRQPVIAVGSNRAPEQLARKFGDMGESTIPVTWAWMHGYDVVYCAHLAGYGSVPATLHGSPGTEVRVAVTWLTEVQLERMHETENVGASYVYGTFDPDAINLGDGRPAMRAGCYITKCGALALDGAPVALAEIEAKGRQFKSLPQAAKLALLHGMFGDHPEEAAWVLSLLGEENGPRRAHLTERLSEKTVPFDDPRFRVILG
ncbi:hypothetical protein [Nisaea denitrificans]|uniref:hypothetical protein n=1 Tax=Nisaea denitrificans TaxID=390877 RepID=UPI00041BA668|nr:hypothetical protein [Nisaea denitrificans]